MKFVLDGVRGVAGGGAAPRITTFITSYNVKSPLAKRAYNFTSLAIK